MYLTHLQSLSSLETEAILLILLMLDCDPLKMFVE